MRERFWALPLACAAAAVGAGLALTELDDRLDTTLTLPFLFAGGPEGARAVLSAIITSMISFTGLVFSITIVVLQLSSSQFSPRILRTFLEDRRNQAALGVFVATFVYALVVLRGVRGTAETAPFVPQVAVTVAFGFVLASVVVFLLYIHHIAQSIRVATILSRIGDETRDALENLHPRERPQPPAPLAATGPGRIVTATRGGVVRFVDGEALAVLAGRTGSGVRLLRQAGEFVPTGGPLARVTGEDPPPDDDVRSAVVLGDERSIEQDLGFGFRQLVDIAERALSPGINDPTTALQAVDQLHDLLRRLATRPVHAGRQYRTDEGRVAVDVPGPGFADYLALSVDEIAHWGADVPRVARRLRELLRDLAAAARPEHGHAVRDALERLGWSDDAPAVPEGPAS
jgi:uncharacterized membrane protein